MREQIIRLMGYERLPGEHDATVHTYCKDQRTSWDELQKSFDELAYILRASQETITTLPVRDRLSGRMHNLPVRSITTQPEGPALWIIAGIHGEEPGGPIAIAANHDVFLQLHNKNIPLVILPLCNPKGYILDMRYPNARKERKLFSGISIGDADHMVEDPKHPDYPRRLYPKKTYNGLFTSYVYQLTQRYPPRVVLDLHEDDEPNKKKPNVYIYSHGELGVHDKTARKIVAILDDCGIELKKEGETKFGERIVDGIVAQKEDGSIDHMLASREIFVNGMKKKGPNARSVVVLEIPTRYIPLEARVMVHSLVLQHLEEFWSSAPGGLQNVR